MSSSRSSPIKGSFEELREKCKSLGLGSRGSKAELGERIAAQIAATATTSDLQESGDRDPCDVLLATDVGFGIEEDMRAGAVLVLQEQLDTEELEVETRADGKVAVGNRRGLNMTAELADMRAEISALKAYKEQSTSEISTLQDHKEQSTSEISALQDRVQTLAISLNQYKLVRGRFLSTFKRDILGTADDADRAIIHGGNMSAHGGDAVMDAQLYQGSSGRRDVDAYKRLYGLNPLLVHQLSEFFAVQES